LLDRYRGTKEPRHGPPRRSESTLGGGVGDVEKNTDYFSGGSSRIRKKKDRRRGGTIRMKEEENRAGCPPKEKEITLRGKNACNGPPKGKEKDVPPEKTCASGGEKGKLAQGKVRQIHPYERVGKKGENSYQKTFTF